MVFITLGYRKARMLFPRRSSAPLMFYPVPTDQHISFKFIDLHTCGVYRVFLRIP